MLAYAVSTVVPEMHLAGQVKTQKAETSKRHCVSISDCGSKMG